MEKRKYDLDVFEALKIVLEGGSVKGENFTDGVFLKLNSNGELVTVDACRLYQEEELKFFKSLSYQKFRKITVATVKELLG